MLNKLSKRMPKNTVFKYTAQRVVKGMFMLKGPKAFKSRVPAEVWSKMSYEQRNAHKAKQAVFKKTKRLLKIKFASAKRLVGYNSTDRKFSKRRRFRPAVRVSDLVATTHFRKSLHSDMGSKDPIRLGREIYAFKRTCSASGVQVLKKHKSVKKSFKRLFGIFKFTAPRKLYKLPSIDDGSNKIIYWNIYLPTYYIFSTLDYKSMVVSEDFIHFLGDGSPLSIDKRQYGCVVFVNDILDTAGEETIIASYEILKSHHPLLTARPMSALKESAIIALYANLVNYCATSRGATSVPRITKSQAGADSRNRVEKRGYLKHVIRMRYRWFFQPKLSQFKLFKKFFKRSLKRYRKINKDKLFVSKFRSHFPKLTGFTEKGLLQMWLPFRRGYNQYWSTTNAVLRFSQSLLLTPASLLVFLQLSPSFAASKHIVKSGAVSINGLAVTTLTQFRPGDIMQLNFVIWKSVRHFFDYQKWNNDFKPLSHLSFLQVDWSSLMFMMVRWPRKYELVAPSFLSERWVRYYIRQFPSKIRNFRKAGGNWKVYKRIITKR